MTNAFTVEAALEWKTNVPEMLRQITVGFENVQRQLSRFNTDLKELTASGRGISGLARAFEKIKIPAAALQQMQEMASITRGLADAQATMAQTAKETATAWREMASASKQVRAVAPGGGGRTRGGGASHGNMMDVAIGGQMVGDAGVGFFESALKPAIEVGSLMTQFRQNNGISESDLKAIRTKAEGMTGSVPGTTVAENLHTILDAFTITGQIGDALAASPAMAKLRMVYQSLPGAGNGDPSYAAAQAVEVMQRFYNPVTHQVDMGAMTAQISAMQQVAVGTGGRVSGDAYLAFARQARLGGMLANDEFLYRDLPALLISLRGSRAGTGDSAVYRQFIQGKMTRNAYDQLEQFGLIDKSAVWKHGQVQGMSTHLRGASTFIPNPAEWVREVLMPALQGHGVDLNNRASVGTNIGQWSSTSTGLGFMLELALGMPGILKEKSKIAATNKDPMSVIEQYDPAQKMREFHAAETNLMTALGDAAMGPALDALKSLTGSLRELTEWAKKNPTAARDLMLVGGGMAVMAKAAGDLAMIIFIGGPLIGGMTGLARAAGAFAPGLPAAAGLSSLTSSLMLAAGGLVALSGAGIGDKDTNPQARFRVRRPDGRVGGGGTTDTDAPNGAFANWVDKRLQDLGIEGRRPAIVNFNVDGKKIASAMFGSGSTQGGYNGHDGKMGLLPAGMPAGGGN